MNDVVGPRLYGEDEIARILKRATEIQIAEPSLPSSSGMTLQELEDVAAEAGIDPRHLRRAATELDVGDGDPSLWDKLVGGRLAIELCTVIPGELSAVGFERVLAIIQQGARHHGQGTLLGHTLTWQGESADGKRSLMVVVSARDGETSVRIEERLHGFAGALFGGMVGGGGMGAGMGIGQGIGWGVLGSPVFAVAFPIGMVGLTYIAARSIYRSRFDARRELLTRLLDRIAREAADSIDEPVPDELRAPRPSKVLPAVDR